MLNKYSLIQENESPLLRVVLSDKNRINFQGDFLATHIGNGIFISVAHPLISNSIPFKIKNDVFEKAVLNLTNDRAFLNKHYLKLNDIRVLSNLPEKPNDPNFAQTMQKIADKLSLAGIDQTVLHSINEGFMRLNIAATFSQSEFYSSKELSKHFEGNSVFNEPNLNRTTFFMDLEICHIDRKNDVAIFRINNVDSKITSAIPVVSLDFTLLDFESEVDLYCLQGGPSHTFGRTLNKSKIEGIVNNFSPYSSSNSFEGNRYLLNTYFKFGSSGAPYLIYNKELGKFFVNAIQSEACPIQMDINGVRNGMQYTRALATPIANLELVISELLRVA